MTPLEAARAYARRGWHVFPIRQGQKIPATERGLLDATTDLPTIEKWWTYRSGWDKRNVAVVTSRKSGIWVLDCDIDDETGELVGEATLNTWIGRYGPLPPHAIARTPKGGSHHIFSYPPDSIDIPRRIKFAPGLDALGSRTEEGVEKAGYFLVYPSSRNDGEYKWEVPPSKIGDAMPQAPDWLIQLIRADAAVRPEGMPKVDPVRSGKTDAYGRTALYEECIRIASCPPGSQDVTLRDRATRIGSLVGGGHIDEQEAFTSLVNAGLQMVNAGRPWTAKEIEKKVRRFMAHGARDPYQPRPLENPRVVAPTPIKQVTDAPEEKPRTRPQLVTVDQVKVADPPKAPPSWMMGKPWRSDENDKLKPKEAINCLLMIEHHPDLKGMFSYNEFADRVMINRPLPGYEAKEYPRQVGDHDEAALTAWLNWHGIAPSFSMVAAYIREVAFRQSFDPLRDWLNSLAWDGKPRIDRWLTYYCAADDSEYVRVIGRRFLVSAVARALSPGCKVDTMIVLEGQQRLGKSTVALVLFGEDYFSDQVGDITSKDSAERIQGCWCVEISEMDKFSRVETNAVKSYLSHRNDRYRPAYGRNTVVRPRRCVFFGTINPDGRGYLKDSTGNTRFWPVKVSHIALEDIAADRYQIWAEAVAAYRGKEQWWLSADEERLLAEPEQDARRDDDVWEPKIRDWIDERDKLAPILRFTSADCLAGIGIDTPRQGLSEKYRIAKALKLIGCEDANNQDGFKGRFWIYRRK